MHGLNAAILGYLAQASGPMLPVWMCAVVIVCGTICMYDFAMFVATCQCIDS